MSISKNPSYDPMTSSSDQMEHRYFNSIGGPLTAAFDVTSLCNFCCTHCYNDSGKQKNNELSDEEALSVAQQVADFGCTTVCLCGGEPLLRGNILEIVKTISTKCGSVNMVSNGSLATKQKLQDLKKAGLFLIQFSLDGANELQHDTLRKYPGSYKLVLEAINHAKSIGLRVITSYAPTRINYHDFDKYVDLCHSLGVDEIRSMPMIPMGRGSGLGPLLMSGEEYIEFQQTLLRKREEMKGKGIHIEWGDPIDHLYRMPNNAKIGVKTYSMEIKSDGSLSVSTYLPIRVGNIRRHSLKEYWDGGYNNIWGDPRFTKYLNKVFNVYDFDKFEPRPYNGDFIEFDIVDNPII